MVIFPYASTTIQNFQIWDTFYLGAPNSSSPEMEANYHPTAGLYAIESRGNAINSAALRGKLQKAKYKMYNNKMTAEKNNHANQPHLSITCS